VRVRVGQIQTKKKEIIIKQLIHEKEKLKKTHDITINCSYNMCQKK
jgi:hypothetical protein